MHLPSSTPLISIIPPLFPYLFLFFFLCNSKDYSRWIKIKRVSPFLHSRHPSFLNLKDFLRGKLNLHTRVFRSSFFPFFDIRRFASSSFKNKTLSPRCFLDMKFGYMEGRVNPETIRDSPFGSLFDLEGRQNFLRLSYPSGQLTLSRPDLSGSYFLPVSSSRFFLFFFLIDPPLSSPPW